METSGSSSLKGIFGLGLGLLAEGLLEGLLGGLLEGLIPALPLWGEAEPRFPEFEDLEVVVTTGARGGAAAGSEELVAGDASGGLLVGLAAAGVLAGGVLAPVGVGGLFFAKGDRFGLFRGVVLPASAAVSRDSFSGGGFALTGEVRFIGSSITLSWELSADGEGGGVDIVPLLAVSRGLARPPMWPLGMIPSPTMAGSLEAEFGRFG